MLMAGLQAKADVLNTETSNEPHEKKRRHIDPPIASPPRRAKSYTHFHHLARARQKRQDGQHEHAALVGRKINDERAFDEWFDGLSDDLLDSTHTRYRSEKA